MIEYEYYKYILVHVFCIVSSSIVYKLGANLKFSEHQRIETHGAVDVSVLQLHSLTLLVFASNRGDVVSSPQTSVVYRWDSTAQSFFRHTDIQTNRVNKISSFIATDSTGEGFSTCMELPKILNYFNSIIR